MENPDDAPEPVPMEWLVFLGGSRSVALLPNVVRGHVACAPRSSPGHSLEGRTAGVIGPTPAPALFGHP